MWSAGSEAATRARRLWWSCPCLRAHAIGEGWSATVAVGMEQLCELSAALPSGRTCTVDRPLHDQLRFSAQRRCHAVGDHAVLCQTSSIDTRHSVHPELGHEQTHTRCCSKQVAANCGVPPPPLFCLHFCIPRAPGRVRAMTTGNRFCIRSTITGTVLPCCAVCADAPVCQLSA